MVFIQGTMLYPASQTKSQHNFIFADRKPIMVQDVKIQNNGINGLYGGDRPQKAEKTSGSWRGESIVLAQVDDVDEKIQIETYMRSAGLKSETVDHKPLAQRKVGVDQRATELTPDKISAYTHATGSSKSTSKIALKYLQSFISNGKEAKPKQEKGLNDLMQRFMGLQKLASALRGNDNDFVAQLTPFEQDSGTLGEIGERLRETKEDPEELAELMKDIEGMPSGQEELYSTMKTLRFQPDQLKRKLRDAQNIPNPSVQERKELLEKVEDELRELERTDGGRIHASLNSLGSASKSGNAENFIEGYNDLVHESTGFSQSLEKLLQRYKPAELVSVLPLMKQALADDLGADLRSTDPIKLRALMSDLSYMHISTTLLDMVSNLTKSIQRIYRAPTTA